MNHPLKSRAKNTYNLFAQHVPSAQRIKEALYLVGAGNVRVKLAESLANQVQVWRGEPIAVHTPNETGDTWHVLDVRWQLQYARNNPKAAQHASHAFDCMAVPIKDLPPPTPLADLCKVLEAATTSANNKLNRAVLNAVRNTRTAVADVLIDSLEPVVEAATEANNVAHEQTPHVTHLRD